MDENALEAVNEAVKVSRLMSDMVKAYDRQNRRLWVAVLALAGTLVITAGCMIWAVTNAQRIANEAMLNALNSVAEIGVTEETTTTTTTVNQDTGEGSGNNLDTLKTTAPRVYESVLRKIKEL